MADYRPGFFRVAARSFFDPGIFVHVLPDGARGAFKYVLKLAALAAALIVGAQLGYMYYQTVKVLRPLIESKVKPAFKDSPALSWKDGVLTAEGQMPFRAIGVDLPDTPLSMVIDTRDQPDTADLTRLPGATYAYTARRRVEASRGKIDLVRAYDAAFNGQSIPAGQAYRLVLAEPQLFSPNVLIGFLMLALILAVLMSVGALVAGGVAVAIQPESLRALGFPGVWTVAAHAATPGLAVFVVLFFGLSFGMGNAFAQNARLWWILWAAPLAVAMVWTVTALRACMGPAPPRPVREAPKKEVRMRDDDLLPPGRI